MLFKTGFHIVSFDQGEIQFSAHYSLHPEHLIPSRPSDGYYGTIQYIVLEYLLGHIGSERNENGYQNLIYNLTFHYLDYFMEIDIF